MGYEYADAQNYTVRCFLNQFFKQFNYFDNFYRRKTIEYFDNKCPYTGIELTYKNSVRDHIIPMNRESCGLHIYGNILIVSKEANSRKAAKSLDEFLANEPQRLKLIRKFIAETGYQEIHDKYNKDLQIICKKLYTDVGDLVEKTFDNYTQGRNLYTLNKPKKNEVLPKRSISYCENNIKQKENNNININNSNNLSKSEIKNICNKNGFSINSDYTKATKNLTQNNYWANPNVEYLRKEWKLVLNDNYNKILYCFIIPAFTIKTGNIKLRTDNPKLIDLQINYNDNFFIDSRSKISFFKWLVKTIHY